MNSKPYYYTFLPSPVGKLKLIATNKGLAAVLWEDDRPTRVRLGDMTEDKQHPILAQTAQQLTEFFEGKRQRFTVKLDAHGTVFQSKVWNALSAIPFGETRTYAGIARQIGHPTAVRAVGAANGRNPISIIVPCHRVIGSDGSLTGFAGGLKTKEFLLSLEGHKPQRQLQLKET